MVEDSCENKSNNTKPSQQSNFLTNGFLPIMVSSVTNELPQLDFQDFIQDPIAQKATYERENIKLVIEEIDALSHPWLTSAKKLLDTAILYLTYTNYGRNITQPTVMIPLIEYGEANGYVLTPRIMDTEEEQKKENANVQERLKRFKKLIRRDLDCIQHTRYSVTETKGRNKGNYVDQGIISSHAIIRENKTTYIMITFDFNMAQYLANSYMAQFPTVLLRIGNQNPNAYSIGRKIAMHSSYYRNITVGTANTLKVRTLIDSAPEIQTYDELKKSGERNWKLRTKGALEHALEINVAAGFIIRWTYRDPKTRTTYTPEEANSLSWTEFYNLDIDFDLQKNPKQNEHRQKKVVDQLVPNYPVEKLGGAHDTNQGVLMTQGGGCS